MPIVKAEPRRQSARTHPLSLTHPQLAAEWHRRKNGELSPDDVVPGSGKRVWWKCAKNPKHEWQAVVNARARGQGACPSCNSTDYNLNDYKEHLNYWHERKNEDIDLTKLKCKTVYWWKCKVASDHSWQRQLYKQLHSKHPCPFCANRRQSKSNSLLAVAPKVAEEFHPYLNGDVKPDAILASSMKKVWWQCRKNNTHNWQVAPYFRAVRGYGCPYCRGSLVAKEKTLAVLNPQLAAQWHPVRNNALTPADVLPNARKIVWWQCELEKEHVWQAPIYSRSRGHGCPKCAVEQKRKKVDLTKYPELFKLWSQELNKDLDVKSLDRNSYVQWKCPKGDDHIWQTKLLHKMKYENQAFGCPYCSANLVSVTNCLATIAPEIAEEFSEELNNGLTAYDVVAASNKKVWWQCRNDSTHVWQSSPHSRVKFGSGCHYCSWCKPSDTRNLAVLHPEIASQWHPTKNKGLSPSDVLPGSNIKVWWQCPTDKTHVWQTAICNRTKGSNCHICAGQVKVNLRKIPHLYKLWNAKLNPGINVTKLTKRVRYWWQCFEHPEHIWETSLLQKMIGAGYCPYCVTPHYALHLKLRLKASMYLASLRQKRRKDFQVIRQAPKPTPKRRQKPKVFRKGQSDKVFSKYAISSDDNLNSSAVSYSTFVSKPGHWIQGKWYACLNAVGSNKNVKAGRHNEDRLCPFC